MISISIEVIKGILKNNEAKVEEIIDQTRDALVDFRDNPVKPMPNGAQPQPIDISGTRGVYLNLLIDNIKSIVLAEPNLLETYKDRFDILISGVEMRNHHRDFKNELLRRMKYESLRSRHYPIHFKHTGIKTCVYCNSQLAITVQSTRGKRRARFQVDHFLPKSEYPCFSISYFNLYPSCGPCNGRKSAKPAGFDLYTRDPNKLVKSDFSFSLESGAIANYRIHGNPERLKFNFSDENYDKAFDISGIYNTQKDVLEELVLKSIIYNSTYLDQLKSSFQALYPEKVPLARRLFIGNYITEPEIHKRPLSKFTQDIARQLDLI